MYKKEKLPFSVQSPFSSISAAEYLNYLSSHTARNPQIQNGGYNTFRDLLSSEYGILDKVNFLRGIVTTFNHVYLQLYEIDLRTGYMNIDIPVYFYLGRHDINAPVSLAEEYFEVLNAPYKEIICFNIPVIVTGLMKANALCRN